MYCCSDLGSSNWKGISYLIYGVLAGTFRVQSSRSSDTMMHVGCRAGSTCALSCPAGLLIRRALAYILIVQGPRCSMLVRCWHNRGYVRVGRFFITQNPRRSTFSPVIVFVIRYRARRMSIPCNICIQHPHLAGLPMRYTPGNYLSYNVTGRALT